MPVLKPLLHYFTSPVEAKDFLTRLCLQLQQHPLFFLADATDDSVVEGGVTMTADGLMRTGRTLTVDNLVAVRYPNALLARSGGEDFCWRVLFSAAPDLFDLARTEVSELRLADAGVVEIDARGNPQVVCGHVRIVDRHEQDDEQDVFEVIVGNIGTVYRGKNYATAELAWKEYAEMSREQYGRAGGEPVTLIVTYPNGLQSELQMLSGSSD